MPIDGRQCIGYNHHSKSFQTTRHNRDIDFHDRTKVSSFSVLVAFPSLSSFCEAGLFLQTYCELSSAFLSHLTGSLPPDIMLLHSTSIDAERRELRFLKEQVPFMTSNSTRRATLSAAEVLSFRRRTQLMKTLPTSCWWLQLELASDKRYFLGEALSISDRTVATYLPGLCCSSPFAR